MKGTEKQIKWAEDIKAQAISHCRACIAANTEAGLFAAETELYEIMAEGIEACFARVDDAAIIIDKRDRFAPSSIDAYIRQAKTLIRQGRLTVEQFAAKNGVKR